MKQRNMLTVINEQNDVFFNIKKNKFSLVLLKTIWEKLKVFLHATLFPFCQGQNLSGGWALSAGWSSSAAALLASEAHCQPFCWFIFSFLPATCRLLTAHPSQTSVTNVASNVSKE